MFISLVFAMRNSIANSGRKIHTSQLNVFMQWSTNFCLACVQSGYYLHTLRYYVFYLKLQATLGTHTPNSTC